MYSVYSKFNINLHKATFIDYLEVIIDENGTVFYAVPSHQEFLINYACDKLEISRSKLYDMCPPEYYVDVLTWLCSITRCISVWNSQIIYYDQITAAQYQTLIQLKSAGLYNGDIPEPSI